MTANNTYEEIMQQLQALGEPSIKKVLLKHGIQEPLYGVKVEELKKINKKIKNGHELALKLYESGVYDAMYLAGLVAQPAQMRPGELQSWAEKANSPALREYTVAWVAAESGHGMAKAIEWINSGDEHLATTGWATLASLLSITPDAELNIPLLSGLLDKVARDIHNSGNREKLAMNSYVISAGIYVSALNEAARLTAAAVGKVSADMGDTACKIPSAEDYIAKAEAKNATGKKKKSARCM
ncbi:MAG: DNA alkylation repair protein [Taibaiella sp.]|nr:DNA alkylation repair protein [Taibaiella sp.]